MAPVAVQRDKAKEQVRKVQAEQKGGGEEWRTLPKKCRFPFLHLHGLVVLFWDGPDELAYRPALKS